MPAVRRLGSLTGRTIAITGASALLVAGCAAQVAPSPSATAAATPTPVPTATPLPGQPLAAGYRPEGAWTVAFARPGDIIRETYEIALTCPDGACDAIVRISDDSGADLGKGRFDLVDDRYVFTSETTRTVDCTVPGRTVPRGATEQVATVLVVASYRITGTAREAEGIRGTRTVSLEPLEGSDCAPSTTVYPATGEFARDQP